MVWCRWHAEGTERIWIFHSMAYVCERGRDCAYTGMLVRQNASESMCGLRERHSRHKPCRQSLSPWTDMLCPTIGIHFLTRNRLIAGSKFNSHSQLVYGPCMSSLTAAVFTSRWDWYRKTGRSPAPVSSSPLWLSSHPYAACPRTTCWLERFIPFKHLDFSEMMTGSITVLLSVCCGSFASIVQNTCSMQAHYSEMLQFVWLCR